MTVQHTFNYFVHAVFLFTDRPILFLVPGGIYQQHKLDYRTNLVTCDINSAVILLSQTQTHLFLDQYHSFNKPLDVQQFSFLW